MSRRIVFALTTWVASMASTANAITTASGQVWNFEPDAWARSNGPDTAYFGWDVLETGGAMLGFGRVLDDPTPDLGSSTTAISTRLFQGANGAANPSPTAYGHRSGSSNYYSGLGDADVAFDTITATVPASGSGGFTTVVLHVLGGAPSGMGPNRINDLSFQMLSAGWTQQKDLYGRLPTGTGAYWQEWTAPGADLNFAIRMTSATSSRSIDAFQVDSYWSPIGPVVNAIAAIPEPSAAALAVIGLLSIPRLSAGGRRANRGRRDA